MPPNSKSRPVVANTPGRTPEKPLRLRDASSQLATLAARRPMVATHLTGTTTHAQHHVFRKAQA